MKMRKFRVYAQQDDLAKWRLQQENNAKPFPYVFPQMPPRFRRYCIFSKAVFLLELVSFGVAAFGSFVVCIPCMILGVDEALEKPFFAFFAAMLLAAVSFCFLFMLLSSAPKFFWHCPCCGLPFPYYASRRSRLDMLKGKECLHAMKGLHIKYMQPKLCPMVIPSVCPECRAKFFDMEQVESSRVWIE